MMNNIGNKDERIVSNKQTIKIKSATSNRMTTEEKRGGRERESERKSIHA
jgi:hypothetical protein